MIKVKKDIVKPRITEAILLAFAGDIKITLEEALTAKEPGSATTRLDMANAFNSAAGYEPFSD